MIDTIHMIGMPSEGLYIDSLKQVQQRKLLLDLSLCCCCCCAAVADAMKRLIQAGLDLLFYPVQFAAEAAANVS